MGLDCGWYRPRDLRPVAAALARLALRGALAACCSDAGSRHIATCTRPSASIPRAPAAIHAPRCAVRAASTFSRASRSTGRSRALPLLAQSREPAAVHAPSRIGRAASTDTISHWRARRVRRGTIVEWDAEINNEVPNKLIAWRSLEGSDVVSAGSVNFDAARRRARGTRVTVHLQYSPPGGKVGAAVARLFGRDAGHRDPRGPAPLQAARRGWRSRRRREGQPRGWNAMKALCWYGTERRARRARSRSEDHQSARRDRQGHPDGDLRLRPAPLRRLHPDDEARRHPRPRVHGRGRRGRPRQPEPQDRRSRRRAVHDRVRPLLLLQAAICGRLCDNSNPNAWMAREAVRLLRRRACSATRT